MISIPKTRLGISSLRLSSLLRGGFKKREWNQGTLRFLILTSFKSLRDFWGYGGYLELPPKPA